MSIMYVKTIMCNYWLTRCFTMIVHAILKIFFVIALGVSVYKDMRSPHANYHQNYPYVTNTHLKNACNKQTYIQTNNYYYDILQYKHYNIWVDNHNNVKRKTAKVQTLIFKIQMNVLRNITINNSRT